MTSVLLIALCACVHGYLLVSKVPLDHSVLILWNLGLFGLADIEEFENMDNLDDEFRVVLKIIYLVVTFGVTVVLMNIFIGVVGDMYSKAHLRGEALFLRTQAV